MACISNLTYVGFIIISIILIIEQANCALREGDCEVCIKFLSKFEKTLTDEDRKDSTEKLKKACNKAKNKENKFCYYIGGTKDSATYSLKEITRPLSFHKPVTAICEALKKKDAQICELVYDKELDWKNINLKKMRVKQLKNILNDWDETCSGCLEKSDFVKKIESVKHKHVEL